MTLEQISENRCRHDILAEILTYMDEPRRASRVFAIAGINWMQWKRYSTFLQDNKLVEINDGYWTISAQGKVVLRALQQLKGACA